MGGTRDEIYNFGCWPICGRSVYDVSLIQHLFWDQFMIKPLLLLSEN